MKTCPTCEGQGSIPDSYQFQTDGERRERTQGNQLLAGWIVAAAVFSFLVPKACPSGCVTTRYGTIRPLEVER